MRLLLLSVIIINFTNQPIIAQFISAQAFQDHPHKQNLKIVQDKLATTLNAHLKIDIPVYLTSGPCGQENAFFQSNNGNGVSQITMCSEFIDKIIKEFKFDGLNQSQLNEAVYGNVYSILLHEVGHALIYALNIPVLGREEDAADGLAALLLSNNPRYGYWAAEFHKQTNDFGDTGLFKSLTPKLYFDEHGLDRQRYYNIICWIYGKDVAARDYFLSILPSSRAKRCSSEYLQLKSSWNQLLEDHFRQSTSSSVLFSKVW